MPLVAILGAGPIGAATAEALARRGRVRAIRLIDTDGQVAAGKALDLRQSGPINGIDTSFAAGTDPLRATGADVIVVADDVTQGEWRDEGGLSVVQKIVRAGTTAALVCACPSQTTLLERTAAEIGVPADRLVGSAASAVVSTVRGLAGLELGLSSVELTVVGRPPRFVIGWSAASAAGSLVADRIPAHRLLAISQSLDRFWPPGPYAIGAATAEIVEGLIFGSRRLLPALTVAADGLLAAGTAVLLPLELGRLRVLSHAVPSLSPQERTTLINAL
jgi:hypothetical protein